MRLPNRRSYYDHDYAWRRWVQTMRWGLILALLGELWRLLNG